MKDAWKNLSVVGTVLGVVAVSALGLAYWSNVQDRERYLQSRNFRLLAVLASQTEEIIENRGRVFEDAALSAVPYMKPGALWTPWSGGPDFRTARRDNPALHELAGGEAKLASTPVDSREIQRQLPGYTRSVSGDGSSLRFDWFSGSKEPFVSIRVPAGETLRRIFDPKIEQGAFDTVLLADARGQVVYAAGRRMAEMHATSVTALLPSVAAAGAATPAFANTISEQRVQIAGVDYRMFMQPCCRSDSRSDSVQDRPTGFVVVGLVEAQALLEASLAISPVLVLAAAVGVIGLLVGWSFLKVACIGPRQRVTRVDVLQLGASGIFGLAIATILLLTTAAYARLSADVDDQLEKLADRLDERLSDEVKRAAAQLTQMTKALTEAGNNCVTAATPPTTADASPPPDPCSAITTPWSDRRVPPKDSPRKYPDLPREYPRFTAYALLDTTGFQRIKVAFNMATQRRLDVAERGYFQQARSGEGLWKLATACSEGCYLESHWSWTTGKPQVVLSTPTSLELFPVAALSIPIEPLLQPVLPPSFEFAIIDAVGQVHFHSDAQRNVHENLLLETDQNRRLLSLVTTHGAGTLNTSYWGRPYRAYVRPTLIPGWSIVALHAKQPARALVLEWSAVALLMQSGYMALWIVAALVLMAFSTSWLWPDPLRRPWYRALSIMYGAALLFWMVIAVRTSLDTTVWIGVLLPPALWVLTYLILRTRPKEVGQARRWSDLCREYRWAGTLMLASTAAVPGASFFVLSSDRHLEAYLKERQIALAHDVERSTVCREAGAPSPRSVETVRYEDVFYGSQVTCVPAEPVEKTPPRIRRRMHLKSEDYVPYFTSAAVALRELMHDRSDDDAWANRPPVPGKLAVTVRVREPRYRLLVQSPVLPVVGVRPLDVEGEPDLVWSAVVPLVLLAAVAAAAYWMMGYLLRRVVLADVVEPVRADGHVVTSPGQHVLVICDQPATVAQQLSDVLVLPVMPVVTADNVAAAWRKAQRAVSETGPMQRIAIPDLDEQSDDTRLMRRKLELVEGLMAEPEQTVLLLTSMSKRALTSCVRDSWKWSHERSSKLLAQLTVVDTRSAADTGGEASSLDAARAWWRQLADLLRERAKGLRESWKGAYGSRDWRTELLDSEAAAYQPIEPFCRDLRDTPAFKTHSLTRDQILEELEERAGSIFRNLWQTCDKDERIILEHVAQHGLASAASRRVVRRLLARGLLRKDPQLRLMNRSFRRFVLESERRQEVVVLERESGPSLWDHLRTPLGTAAVIAAAFLAATQREAFNATLTMAAGVTTALPMLVKFTTLVAQFAGKPPADGKANV